MKREPLPHVLPAIRAAQMLSHDAGFVWVRPHVSRFRSTLYVRLQRSDGYHARLRISDHRSATYRVGKCWSGRNRLVLAMQVLTHRPGTMRALGLWLRSHSLDWPRPDGVLNLENVIDQAYPSPPPEPPQAVRGAVLGT